ncbi:IgA peptidase M64-domain-containing protein [Epithele typhae]|uniref:IgA peptidase M64-domain-containing protein n=1 Tax=Epithele typhae TaxID=378194 RepID=UPI0020078CFD|nr:IgA peptidase M64-domain-containing protein [Epithele typhae]KAH9932704.1 IgA peptidase M64-domain-containing protein [Epithele typhae]
MVTFACIVGLLLPLAKAAGVNIASTTRPFELVVNRALGTGQCTFLALQDTQPFKALPDDGHFKRRLLPTGEERFQFVTLDEGHAWEKAESLCGPPHSWDFHVRVDPTLDRADATTAGVRVDPPPLEVEPLFVSGPASNRVDLVFFADGYLQEERARFFEDARRLARDISQNHTFATVRPLLNFWAAFTPSAESGVGRGGVPKDTVFGLCRPGTELRALYCTKEDVARAACASMGDQCDYPIIVGNDPLYGGLEGEITTITPSLANGALVLRHELGHSIILAGEEYDGSEAEGYYGVNAAHSTARSSVPWAHWLSPASSPAPAHLHGAQHPLTDAVRIERAVMPLQDYAWAPLNASAPWSTTFISAGTFARGLVRFSLAGVPRVGDLRVALDGQDLRWAPRADIGVDRWHYDIELEEQLGGGEHVVSFELQEGAREGVAQLCSVEVLEFGNEDEFVSTPGHYGLYPTFSDTNKTTYRPTNEDCLMRIVTTPDFCSVCMEGLWHALLRRVDLIDGLTVECSSDSAPASPPERTFNLSLIPLAHLRETSITLEEGFEITWTKDGVEVPEFTNQTRLVDDGGAVGEYAVWVRYKAAEVRVDPDGLLEARAMVTVTTTC